MTEPADDDATAAHTPTRPVRVETELWKAFGRRTGRRNRAQVLRQFMRWYIREPGAKLPTRPPAEDG